MRTLALVTLLALSACKIGDTVYQGPGGDDDGDGPIVDAAVDAPDGIYVQVTPSMISVGEGGQVTVQVRLSEAPPADRTIDVQGGTRITPTPASLTFTPENWNVNRTVILAAGQDDDAVDSQESVVFFGQSMVADGLAMVMITDDDLLALIVSPPTSIGVTEGGSGTVSVSLTAQPTGTVAITVATTDTMVAGVSPGQLTFNTGNWFTPQTVMVTGADDVDTSDDSTELVFDPALEGIPPHTVQVNVTDNDVVAIDVDQTSLALTEAAGTGHQRTIQVRLTRPPAAPLTVDVADTPGGEVALGNTQLSFDSGNYNVFQPVVVTALDDGDTADEDVTIALTAPMVADRLVQVSVADDDVQVIEVTPGSIADLDEGTFTNLSVRLRYEPAGPVLVDLDSADATRLSLSTTQLTFTPADYDTPQVVRVDALDDADLANQTVTASFNSSALGLTTNVPVTIDDEDMQDLLVAPTALSIAEGGMDVFTVRLLFQPAGSVIVGIAGGSGEVNLSHASLTFGPSDYDQPRTVTVTAVQDPDTISEQVVVQVSSSGLSTRSVTVNIADDDALDIVVTPSTITVTEDSSAVNLLMVSLGAMPGGNVMVNLSCMPAGVATLSLSQLTFTQQNYNTPQGVRVTGTTDPDGADETCTLTLTSAGLDDKTVPVSVIDDEVITTVFSQNPVMITEGKPDSRLTVQLSVNPGRNITVTATDVTAQLPRDLGISPTVYNFTATNWNQPQSVTLTPEADDGNDAETEVVSFTIPGETTATLTVNTIDPTIVAGFPPPHTNQPTVTVMGLEGYDTTNPGCWVLEKLKVDVATISGSSAIKVGLYNDGFGKPGFVLWEDVPRTVVMGVQEYTINVPFGSTGTGTAWLVVETTSGVTFRSKTGATATRCRRTHAFGSSFPNPFDSGVITPPLDGGSTLDSGSSILCAPTQPVPAIWLIGRPAESCVDPA